MYTKYFSCGRMAEEKIAELEARIGTLERKFRAFVTESRVRELHDGVKRRIVFAVHNTTTMMTYVKQAKEAGLGRLYDISVAPRYDLERWKEDYRDDIICFVERVNDYMRDSLPAEFTEYVKTFGINVTD